MNMHANQPEHWHFSLFSAIRSFFAGESFPDKTGPQKIAEEDQEVILDGLGHPAAVEDDLGND